MLRIPSFLAIAASVALVGACSHDAAPPVEAPTAAPEATSSAPAQTAPAETAPAETAPPEATPAPPASAAEPSGSEATPPPARPAGKRAPCTLGQDQTCNGDASVSAIWGKCLPTGTCECKPGFELAPTGYCKPAK